MVEEIGGVATPCHNRVSFVERAYDVMEQLWGFHVLIPRHEITFEFLHLPSYKRYWRCLEEFQDEAFISRHEHGLSHIMVSDNTSDYKHSGRTIVHSWGDLARCMVQECRRHQ
jgi:hypothetical protein